MTYGGPRYDKEGWRGTVENGRIDASRLNEVEAWPVPFDRDLGGPARAHPEAASAMGVLLRTAWAAGHTSLTIAYSYRTYDMQENKWANYQAGGNLAARPGTSNHGWAVAFDMRWGTSAAFDFLHANARRFGFLFDVTGENWHATLQEGLWNGDDMTKDEKEQLEASQLWAQGEREYREAWNKKKKDPGPAPDNWKTPRKNGWGSARFAVLRIEEHAEKTAAKGHAA